MLIIPTIIAIPVIYLLVRFGGSLILSREASYVLAALLFGTPIIITSFLGGVVTNITFHVRKVKKGDFKHDN